MTKPSYNWKLFIFLSIGLLVFQLIYFFVLRANFVELSERGLFGDSFGALTSLFSGLAFVGMICALVLQTKELSLQREELILSRKAQEGSAQSQAKMAEKQLLSAQIQGVGAIMDSFMQASISSENTSAKREMQKKASSYTNVLYGLLEKSGVEIPDKIR